MDNFFNGLTVTKFIMMFDAPCNLSYIKYNNFDILHPIFKNTLKMNDEIKTCYMRSNSSFDYGWKIGKRYRVRYHIINNLANSFKQININYKIVEEYLSKIREFFPAHFKEFKGLSSSTHIKLERLVYLHILFSYILGSNCTSMLATGKATKKNDTFLIINLDGGILLTALVRFFSLQVWINRHNCQNNYKYAFIGIPIILENPMMNEKGLGLGQTATICNEKRYNKNMNRNGVYISSLIRNTMKTCKNVDEVADLWRNTKIANKKIGDEINQTTAWCDKDDGILMIETGPDMIKTVFGNSIDITGSKEEILWHALHHQWLDSRETGSMLPSENIYSSLNANRARELLETNYGNISLDACKKIARDHGKGEHDGLCKHATKKRLVTTGCSYIVQPKNLTVYLARGNPCKREFCEHDFSNFF